MTDPLLEIRDLRIDLASDGGWVPVIDRISASVARGQVLAIVGESGSGKSVTAQSILRLLPRELRITAGSIVLTARRRSTLRRPSPTAGRSSPSAATGSP